MESIVNRIIEIDQQAEDKLAAAETQQRQILADAKATAAKQRDRIFADADKQIAQAEEAKKAELDRNISGLTAQRDEAIHALDHIFSQQREQLAEDIFRTILGG